MALKITQFTPPASCSTPWFGTKSGATGYALQNGVKCSRNNIVDDENCYPSSASAYPGCPLSWSGGLTKASTIACCPNDFTLTNMDGTCATRFSGSVVEVVLCDANSPSQTLMHTFEFNSPAIFVENLKYVLTKEASSVVSSTPPPVIASTTFSTPISTTSTVPFSTSCSTPTSSQAPQASKDGLSGATIAGIVVGTIASAVLIVAGIMLLERRKRRRVREITPNGYFDSKAELAVATVKNFGETTNATGSRYGAEVSTSEFPVELGSASVRGREGGQ